MIKHPNEFLVALGDNYFVQRTAQECQPILQRRIDKLEDQLKSVETQLVREQGVKGMLHAEQREKDKKWLDLHGNPTTDDSKTHWDDEGCLEIREEVDEGLTSGQDTDVEVLTSD